jgi:uncharacterized membrane protein HdeD (DUF308 family)
MVNNVIRSIAIMLIGLVLIFMSDSAMTLLVRLTGAAFFLPALVSIINLYVSRSENGLIPKVLISVIDVGSMAFGAWLMAAPDHFEAVFVKLLAVVLIVFAVYQVIMIISAQKYSVVPALMFVAPLLIIVVSIVMLSVSFESSSTTSIVFGICTSFSGLSDLLISLKLKNAPDKNPLIGENGELQKS